MKAEWKDSLVQDGITIGITTCRRMDLYIKTLEAIERSDPMIFHDKSIDIIVIDDSSSQADRSKNIICKYHRIIMRYRGCTGIS